jgi:CheY-like chemotaxis protein
MDMNCLHRALLHTPGQREEYDVVLAASGADALMAFGARQPDCVLLNVRLLVMGGSRLSQHAPSLVR